ncbi:hypothetical protein GJ496_009939 [Pomphorhynchus laevis]|nr:hypothetical protein GJ496_009939 [Pomphorhynchus laevis]
MFFAYSKLPMIVIRRYFAKRRTIFTDTELLEYKAQKKKTTAIWLSKKCRNCYTRWIDGRLHIKCSSNLDHEMCHKHTIFGREGNMLPKMSGLPPNV